MLVLALKLISLDFSVSAYFRRRVKYSRRCLKTLCVPESLSAALYTEKGNWQDPRGRSSRESMCRRAPTACLHRQKSWNTDSMVYARRCQQVGFAPARFLFNQQQEASVVLVSVICVTCHAGNDSCSTLNSIQLVVNTLIIEVLTTNWIELVSLVAQCLWLWGVQTVRSHRVRNVGRKWHRKLTTTRHPSNNIMTSIKYFLLPLKCKRYQQLTLFWKYIGLLL